jgi:histidinol-phosphate aminotransferase
MTESLDDLPIRPVVRTLMTPPVFKPAPAGVRYMQFNEGAWPPSPRVAPAIAAAAAQVNRYGDSHWSRLAPAIAARTGVPAERIVCGNGSAELITYASTAFVEAGRNVVVTSPSFPRLGAGGRIMGGAAKTVAALPDGAHDLEGLLRAVDADTRLFWLTTPNNPTGAAVSGDELRHVAAALPAHVILAVDEAYYEFSRAAGGIDAVEELERVARPWLVMRTFSKAYAMAGLRVGYAMTSSPALAEALHRVRGTFNLNVVAQAAALAAFEDQDYMWARVRECVAERERLRARLERLQLRCYRSGGNFLLIELPIEGAAAQAAIRERGVVVSTIRAPGFERHIRVTIGLKDDNDAFFDALAATVDGQRTADDRKEVARARGSNGRGFPES